MSAGTAGDWRHFQVIDEHEKSVHRAAVRAQQREWDWDNPRCPYSDLQHPPDQHLAACAPFMFDEDDDT